MLNLTKGEIAFLFALFLLAVFVRFYGMWGTEVIKDEYGIMFPRHDSMIKSVGSFLTIPTDDYWIKNENYNYTSDYVKYHFNTGTQSSTTPFGWWLIGLSLLIFGKNAFGARFVPLLFSLLSIFLLYFLVRKAYGKKYAIISSILLAFYPFYITMFRVGQSLEPFVLFFFLVALYFLLFFRKFGRLYWMVFMSTMFFSNFPKAIILALIFFLWEFQRLVYSKRLIFINLTKLGGYYLVALVPTFIWGLIRAKVYGLSSFWFLGHVFARGGQEQFRILEVLYSYGSTKQGALLMVLAVYGVFVFVKSIYNKKVIKLNEELNLLWLTMILLIPILFLFSKQAGAWSHAMASIPIAIFAANGLLSMYKNIRDRNYLSYVIMFYFNWIYVLVVKNMGDLISFVPRNDADAVSLYKNVLIQLFGSVSFVIQISLLTLFALFIILASKYKLINENNLSKILICSLVLSLLAFVSYSFYLVIFGIT